MLQSCLGNQVITYRRSFWTWECVHWKKSNHLKLISWYFLRSAHHNLSFGFLLQMQFNLFCLLHDNKMLNENVNVKVNVKDTYLKFENHLTSCAVLFLLNLMSGKYILRMAEEGYRTQKNISLALRRCIGVRVALPPSLSE